VNEVLFRSLIKIISTAPIFDVVLLLTKDEG